MRKPPLRATSALLACSALPFSMPSAAAEQSASSPVINEIVVTASKRGEVALMETPMAIQAITGEQLQEQGIVEFADYARSISGLSFEDQGPGDKKIVLRGIQSTGAATTGLYFDDIVITGNNRQDGGGRQPDIRLIDMERMEVLKGPQGTLYGASSMSGTIRMITNKPDASGMAAAVNMGLGGTEGGDGLNYDIDGMLNMPLSDQFAVRVVGYRSEMAGFIDNRLMDKEGVNNQVIRGGRVAARWEPTDDVTIDAMWINQSTNSDGSAWFQPIFGEFVQYNHTGSQWEEQLDAYNLALTWDVGHGSISASVSRLERDIMYRFPGTRVMCSAYGGAREDCFAPNSDLLEATPRWSADQPQERSITSSEVRYASDWDSRLQVIGGVYYQKEENDFASRIIMVDPQNDERIPTVSGINLNRTVMGEIEQKAVFGELSFDFTDGLTATVGVRAFRFDVDEIGQNLVTRNRPVAQAPVVTSSVDEDVTFKANVEYQFAAGPLIYATYAEGFRSGGNNEPDFTTGTVLPAYKSDSLSSYEIGAKGRFLDNRLELDLAAYYMNWQDMQARVSAQIEGSPFLMVGNVGETDITGVELGMRVQPLSTSDLQLGLTVSALEAVLAEDGPVGLAGNKDDRIPNVPEFSANAYAEYVLPINSSWETLARVEYAYVGDSFSDFNDTRPIYTRQGDYSLVNLRATMERGSYRLGVFMNNVLNEDAYISSSIDVRRPVEVVPLRPRTYGVSFGYTF